MSQAPSDSSRCPLCGQSNSCTLANPATATLPCWCFSASISADALAQLPLAERNKACLCPGCAQVQQTAKTNL